ncbi:MULTISPECIES: MBL fold metallo-hydrolase [Nocardioides]|uniref:MBL fold metallo-hydrolase n=1 Tax=Nocardioides vastitatis TaxID=2568655 RepID=A0ABW0ZPB0_9ACTN|nr:MBL fold metallo-hydrolase [Nocardioides sp.]THJ16047.1 MBL fold metallo-hydrolase [Nocardioides sp.]
MNRMTSETSDVSGTLSYEVLVVDGQPIPGRPAPDGSPAMWSPTSATLICGERRAVLIDGLTTKEHADALVDWVDRRGLELQTIYVTHGHGDHFFGLNPLVARHPEVQVVALPEVVDHMRQQTSPEIYESLWRPLFGDQIPEEIVTASPLEGDRIDLEGHSLIVHRAGHTDRSDTTFVHVPDLALVVAGDIVYNGVFPFTVETDRASRDEWRKALDDVAACKPARVVAGHKSPTADDDPRHIAETRKFLDDFDAALDSGASAEEMFESLVATHGDRINRTALAAGVFVHAKKRDKQAALAAQD